MAASNITADCRCAFCWVNIREMEDPVELPCGDVHCRGCMDVDLVQKGTGELTCPDCQRVYKEEDIEKSRKVDVKCIVDTTKATTILCDGVGCKMSAVSYCINCNVKNCDTHQQNHSNYYGTTHQSIPIYVYQRTPNKYKKVMCDDHQGEPLIKACSKCYKLVCNECDRHEGGCTDWFHQHEYKDVADVEEEITSVIKNLISKVDSMRMEFSQLNKEAWNKLEDITRKCKGWLEEIVQVRDKQIAEICKESERVKEKVEKYLKEAVEHVEKFTVHLVETNEKLSETRTTVYRKLRDEHVADKIKQNQQMKEELTRCLDVELGGCELADDHSLVVNDQPSTFKADFLAVPSVLTLKSARQTGDSYCYSACPRANGDLLIGCEDGLLMLKEKTGRLFKFDLPYKQVYSVIELHNAVYLLHKENNMFKVEMCLPNLKHSQMLFEFKDSSTLAAYMAVSDRHIVVYNPQPTTEKRQLILYNMVKQTQRTFKVEIHQPFFLSDGKLLAAGNGKLVKYEIADDGNLTATWTCRGLNDIDTACADFDGVIYASTRSRKQCYVISPAGELLRKLGNANLPAKASGQVSLRDGEMAVPGWSDKMVYIFNINSISACQRF